MVCAWRCATVRGCWLLADAQSPVWLQLRTGYILSSGSLSTVPKRDSDDYSQRASTRDRERRGGKERKVNTCTKARLCIGRKDVQRGLPLFFLFFFIPPSSDLLLLLVYQRALFGNVHLSLFARRHTSRAQKPAKLDKWGI